MPITDSYARLALTQIYVDRDGRQRRELKTDNLKDSIATRGVLNPIIVERQTNSAGQHRLTAGERRYMSCVELNLSDIPVRFADELSPIESQIFELEENIKRQDLPWQDRTDAVERIHKLYCATNPDWTQRKTAESIGVTEASISQHLVVSAALPLTPAAQSSKTFRGALAIITRTAERAYEARRADLLFNADIELPGLPEAPPKPIYDFSIGGDPTKNILHESFLDWAPKYEGPAFNLIHCDFPYGINVFAGPQSGAESHPTYNDSQDLHFQLLETLLTNFDRLSSVTCHIVYWFSIQHYDRIRSMIRSIRPDIVIWPHPLIWHKTDNTGIASDVRRGPRHVYETALLMNRGDRPNVKLVSDTYGAPTSNDLHVHTKPEPMLRYFLGMLIDEHTIFLDPTCGSGSSVRAAESLGARSVVGLDNDESIIGSARMALREFRAKRTLHELI